MVAVVVAQKWLLKPSVNTKLIISYFTRDIRALHGCNCNDSHINEEDLRRSLIHKHS